MCCRRQSGPPRANASASARCGSPMRVEAHLDIPPAPADDCAHEARREGGMLQLKPEGLDLVDAVSRPIAVGGQRLVADNSGALYWPGQRALLVADLALAGGRDDAMKGAHGSNAPS